MSVRKMPLIETEWKHAPLIETEWKSVQMFGRVAVAEIGAKGPAIESLW